jgi:acyl-CoA thioesterase YciA
MEDRFPSIRITMLPKDTNAFGTIFGGVILSYIDLAGAIEVHRHYNLRVVTKAMREVAFVSPVFLGDLVTFFTRVVRIGRTSVNRRRWTLRPSAWDPMATARP